MIVIFWDIDGTLLTTGRAGIFAWEDAAHDLAGTALDLQELKTDGLTDHQVALRIMELIGHTPTDTSLARMMEVYETRLPDRLHMRQGRVLEGVREVLEHLRQHRPDVHSMLLTGNTAAGARAKLARYGLQEFFEGGSFSVYTQPRATIASRALDAVRTTFPDAMIASGHVYVVGDTPHDIDCAKAIGARTIAIGSGGYKATDLIAHGGAWRVLERLPAPAEFVSLIDSP